MTATHQLLEPLVGLRFDEIPDRDRARLQELLLDHVGVAARGAATDTAAAGRAFAAELEPPGGLELPLVGTPERASPLLAALCNGVAAHSIEYDDVHNASSSHPGAVVFPAALAAARLAGADTYSFVCSVVAGYEVMCRAGRAAAPSDQYARHFHPTATCGHLGAAAAAARIFELDLDTAVSALGIASTMASGSMRFLEDGSWVKRLHPGMAARAGIEAAMLARRGFDGGADPLGAARGFLETFSGRIDTDTLLAARGSEGFEVGRTSIKAHTCCRYKQGPIDALLEIRGAHALDPEQVEAVEIGMLTTGLDLVGEPQAAKRRPRSVVDAQFSMPFGAAVALLEGRAGLAQYEPRHLEAPAVVSLMDRVECVTDPELDGAYPEEWRAWARVKLADGRTLGAEVRHPKGDPENPLSPDELRAKFDSLTGEVYSPDRRDAIAEAVATLDRPGALEALISLLGADARSGPDGQAR